MSQGDQPTKPPNQSPLSAEDGSVLSRRELRQQQERRSRRNSWVIFLSVLVVALVILVFFAYTMSSNRDQDVADPEETTTRNPSPGLDGIIATHVSSENFLPGDCLANFEDATLPADIVECSTPHNAQLIGRRMHSQDQSYPGEEQLLESSEAFCADITLLENTQATYSINTTRPSQYTWDEEGDRRVDCIVATHDSSNFSASLIETPSIDDQRSDEEQAENPLKTAQESSEEANNTPSDGPAEPENTQETPDSETAEVQETPATDEE